MNDITTPTADAGSPPPSVPTEVTIPEQSPEPQHGSTGVQAPDKSAEQIAHERTAGRREAIERAFAKSAAAQEGKKAAEEDGKTPGEDRGKGEEKSAQPREKGRFVSSKPTAGVPADEDGRQPAETQQPSKHAPLAADAPYRDAPPRFSEAARADWDAVPESVRGATHQAFQQYERGIQQYRAGAEAFHELREFHDMAQKSGTTIKDALTNYTGIEKQLRSDLFGGIDLIINNMQLRGPNGGRYSVYDFARDVLRLTPEQHRLVQQQNHSQAQNLQIGKLHQQMERLATGFQHMQYQQEFKSTRSVIDKFADTHPGFDDRLDLIKQEMDLGWPLNAAYERAMRLRPDGPTRRSGNGSTHAAQTRDTTAQTRSDEVDRSISGAPNGGTPASQPRDARKKVSSRDALKSAFRKVRSGV